MTLSEKSLMLKLVAYRYAGLGLPTTTPPFLFTLVPCEVCDHLAYSVSAFPIHFELIDSNVSRFCDVGAVKKQSAMAVNKVAGPNRSSQPPDHMTTCQGPSAGTARQERTGTIAYPPIVPYCRRLW